MNFCEIYTFLKNDDCHPILCQLWNSIKSKSFHPIISKSFSAQLLIVVSEGHEGYDHVGTLGGTKVSGFQGKYSRKAKT